MTKDWRASPEGQEHVRRVLLKSGIPLETRSTSIIARFCAQHATAPLRASHLGPALWQPESEKGAWRETDDVVMLQETLGFDDVDVGLQAHFFIEVKYREGVEWFAFAGVHSTKIPVASNAPFSESTQFLVEAAADDIGLSRCTALRFGRNGSSGSVAVADEDVQRNVSASLADAILHLEKAMSRITVRPELVQIVRDLGLPEKFAKRFGDAAWREELPTFLAALSNSVYSSFLNKALHRQLLSMRLYVPILLVNGPIHRVTMSPEGDILDIVDGTFVVTGERLPTWPSGDHFVDPRLHFPLILTNPETLFDALEWGHAYAMKVRNVVTERALRNEFAGIGLDVALAAALAADNPPRYV